MASLSDPQWAGLKGKKVGGRTSRRLTGSVRRFPPIFKTCELHQNTPRDGDGERTSKIRGDRIPGPGRRRRAAESRSDCCPRPRQPFPAVSLAVLGLRRHSERKKNSKQIHAHRTPTSKKAEISHQTAWNLNESGGSCALGVARATLGRNVYFVKVKASWLTVSVAAEKD